METLESKRIGKVDIILQAMIFCGGQRTYRVVTERGFLTLTKTAWTRNYSKAFRQYQNIVRKMEEESRQG